ncbi:ubiquitin carboxyl-terminal hydrolase 37-like [Xyrichtys novacula]|uniref:Ubiquitin carboxyl-terminal hydrolase n=1 Tax=Xyrichtys novacula TaxID=13765 RepID=A0AAV1GCU8_XYRNO|nr:ubiquitin carboxyl-terminal hydrolase 37-like [Xyrichtys novacula]
MERSPKRRRLSTQQAGEKIKGGQKEPRGQEEPIKTVPKIDEKEAGGSNSSNNPLTKEEPKCLGFPNIGQTCYMNASLQSLLTLENFMDDINKQANVWRVHPDAAVMRYLSKLKEEHSSEDMPLKSFLLSKLKRAVSFDAPVFADDGQQDAHEFLCTLLYQIMSLSPELQKAAATKGTTYSCPIKEHLSFKMENTRTCKRCGAESKKQEERMNLSLDVTPGGGTVEDMLQNYLQETELEYRCECGGIVSGQRLSFKTLPRALILHLNRVRYTPDYWLQKVTDPVDISRDLVICSEEDGQCYSLVSTIKHLGTQAGSGHYISEGMDLDVPVTDPSDRWFTYDDKMVTETSGADVCEKGRRDAYILVYKRQVSTWPHHTEENCDVEKDIDDLIINVQSLLIRVGKRTPIHLSFYHLFGSRYGQVQLPENNFLYSIYIN